MKCANCGKDLIPGTLFCASCGAKVPSEIPTPVVPETGKTKKSHTRLIGIIAVAVVVAAAGFGGWKAWQVLHPNMTKQLVYSKDGALYYTGNMDKDSEPIKVYDTREDNGNFYAKLSKDQKYLFFRDSTDDDYRLYRVETQKLTSNESKNDKYIEEIDDDVHDFMTIGSGKALYYRTGKHDYNDLYYYDGKKSQTIDSNVKKQYRAGNIVYYFKYDRNDENGNDILCYYNLSNQKNGEIGEGDIESYDTACSYNENSILFAKCVDVIEDGSDYSYDDMKVYDLYMAKPGSQERKIVSGIVDYSGDVDSGNVYYAKLRQQKHTYYDYVEDPYESQDENASEPYLDDYLHLEDVSDILDEYDYENYDTWTDSEDFFYNCGTYDDDLDEYVFHRNGDTYIESDYFYQWYRVDSSYYDDLEKYNDACTRNEIRDELKDTEYGSKSYDLYLYNSKSGEKKIAESVDIDQLDPKNKMCIYEKIDEKKVTKICSIDDISSIDDLEEKLDDDKQDDTMYASVGGQEQKLDASCVYFECSEDGKTVMVCERPDDGYRLIAYKKKGNSLEKVGTVEKKLSSYSYFVGNDFYYCNTDDDLYVYSNGKSKKIADNVSYMQVQGDGNYTGFDATDDDAYNLQIISSNGEKDTIRDVEDTELYSYIDKSHIVYMKDDDLYVYNGKDSRKIDRNVSDFWCRNRLKGSWR